MNSIQLEELYTAIEKVDLTGKNIIFFGANKMTELGIRYLQGKGIPVYGVIDNSDSKRGSKIYEVVVSKPEELLGEFDDNAVIFLASRYFESMTKQLNELGYEKNIHIFETIYHKKGTSEEEFQDAVDKVKKGLRVWKRFAENNENRIILCPYKGIGDVYFIGAYFEEYCRQKNISDYKFLVVGSACKRVASMFGIKNITAISQEDADCLISFAMFMGIENTRIDVLNHNALYTGIMSQFEVEGTAFWGTIVLRGVMELVGEVVCEKPCYSEEYKTDSIETGKTVILAPYANTVGNVETHIWEQIAEEFSNRGYKVITNSIGPSEPAISGTIPLSIPLESMTGAVEKAGAFIGVRSGLCDVISGAEACKVIFYPDQTSMFFSIPEMGLSRDVYEVRIWEKSEAEILELAINKVLNYADI